MLIQHVIILLLSWTCVRAIEDEKPPPPSDAFDQVATASENAPSYSTPAKSAPESRAPDAVKAANIHYENSNGFIPMTAVDGGLHAGTDDRQINVTLSDSEASSSNLATHSVSGLIEDDPAYSTEARMFLNLPGPAADRRSFDAQDGQNEFEILKVTNETPAIANYHEFYENMQNNLNNRNKIGSASTRHSTNTEPESGRTVAQNQRTKERIKKIEKYLTNFHGERDIDDPYRSPYYSHGSASNKPATSQNKEIFEPEKVSANFHQHSGSSNYDVYGESPSARQRSSTSRTNYDDGATRSKSYGHSAPNKNRHVNSKPVVVVEPGDYKLDLKYGPQQVVGKVSTLDDYRSPKSRKETVEPSGRDGDSHINSEDRYGHSYERLEDAGDYSDESSDYMEITEKPRRMHKNRRRPYAPENSSKRLPKEHRGHTNDDLDLDDSRKHNSATRAKQHRPKAKPSYWIEDDRSPIAEESLEDQTRTRPPTKTEGKNSKHQHSKGKTVTQWSQVAPNIEISHSDGYQVDQVDKPKLLVPVNLNLVPFANFDHSTALGNSQGFDFTNIPSFVTATPMVSTPTPLLSTGHSVVAPNVASNVAANPGNAPKNQPAPSNGNYGQPTSVPDIIVGQNSYQNPVQAVLLPQINVNKYAPGYRTHYLPSTVAPMFTVTQTMSPNVHHLNPTMQTVQNSQQVHNFPSNVTPRTSNTANQNSHHLTMSPVSPVTPLQPQLLMPQPTLQSFPLLQTPYHNSNYNILVNPNGLHGQNVVQPGNQGPTTPSPQPSSTTLQANSISNDNLQGSESQMRKNGGHNENQQFLATASLSVGNGAQHQQGNSISNNNNNNYYNGNQNNQQQQQLPRPQQNEHFYQVYRDDQNNNYNNINNNNNNNNNNINNNNNNNAQRIKTYVHTAQILPGIIHQGQNIPINFNGQSYANIGAQLQEQQSAPTPSIVAQRPRDQNQQNQQILKAANDIFENTWKQLQQLQTTDDASKNSPYQQLYRVNDNLGSTSNDNVNAVNSLQGANSAKAHLPVLGAQNVEIVNPNIRPSPVDMTMLSPYQTLHHYPAAVLTTPIPIFSTTASFLTPRPIMATTVQPINLQSYVDSLTQMGSHSNQVNKLESAPGSRTQEQQQQQQLQQQQRPLFNPINFVPNLDLMKSQSMLNSKLTEQLPHQLNLVPLVPGGNFFKGTYGAQTELVQKPRLSSDLEKYAEEMFKESMKTIYSTHKWNNDRRTRGNYSAAELNDLAKLKSELQRFKASLSDAKQPAKDLLEGHYSETKIRTAEPSRPTKKPELSIAAIEQLFKSDFKHKPSSSDSSPNSHHKNRPTGGHGSSRPSNDHFNDFKNLMQLSDYLTPPKPNSFVSKSPFIDGPKPKKRPGQSPSRYNKSNNNNNNRPRPSALVSRPASGPEASASNHLESGIRGDGSRYEKHHQHRPGKYSTRDGDRYYSDYRREPSFDSYPTFTTTSSPDSGEQTSKTDYYDINHPRMHNLLGLLMKNKQLPHGSPQSFFRDDDELQQYFENEKRRIHAQIYDETMRNFQKKADGPPVNMGPPAPVNVAQVRYYPGRDAA